MLYPHLVGSRQPVSQSDRPIAGAGITMDFDMPPASFWNVISWSEFRVATCGHREEALRIALGRHPSVLSDRIFISGYPPAHQTGVPAQPSDAN